MEYEYRFIKQGFTNHWLWLFLAFTTVAISIIYQIKQPVKIDIGGSEDCPYLGPHEYCMNIPSTAPAWYARETDPSTGTTYRWTRSQSEILLPGLGNQPYNVTLRWAGQPVSTTTSVTITINAQEFHWAIGPDYQEKAFFVPRFGKINSDVRITIESPTFNPRNDARKLGIRLDWVKVEPASYGLRPIVIPSVSVTFSLIITLLIVYLICHRILLRPLFALGAASIILLAMLSSLLFSRLDLTSFASQLAIIMLWTWFFFLLVLIFINPSSANSDRLPVSYNETYAEVGVSGDTVSTPGFQGVVWLAGIFAFAFAIRFGGMVHPQFITSDLTFHAHHIGDIIQFFSGQQPKNFFFDGQLPNGTHVPYPNAYYLLLAPIEWLFGGTTEVGKLLLRFFSALLDASVVLLLYRLAAPFGSIASLAAAFLYAVGPASFQLFSAGNHTNIFAQTMFVASLIYAIKVLNAEQGACGYRRMLLAYLLFSILTMLGHYGMLIAAVGITISIGTVWLIFAPTEMRGRIWPLLGFFAAALIISYLLYYSHYNDQIFGQLNDIFAGSSRKRNGFGVLPLLADLFKWQGWVTPVLAAVGIGCLVTRHDMNRQYAIPARLVTIGWLIGCTPFVLTALFNRDTIRYNYLVMPALCIFGGFAIQRLIGLPASGSHQVARLTILGVIVGAAFINIALVWGNLIFAQYH